MKVRPQSAQNLLRELFPFGWTNVTKLALAYFFSTVYFYIPVGTLYLQSKDLSYVQINSLWGIIVFTMFLTEVPTGIIADRIGRKRAINLALGLQVLGEVIYVFARGYPGFVLAAIAGGLGFAFGSGCVEALAYDTLKAQAREGEMSKAMGYVEAAQRLANLLAFSMGGILVRNLTQERFVVAIVATACMVTVGFLISLSLKESTDSREEPDQSSSLQLLRDGLCLLKSNKLFRRLALLSLATVPFRDYLGSLYQPHFVEAGVPPLWFGLALSIASGLSILGARYAHWLEERLSSTTSLLLVSVLPGLLYLVMAAVSHPAFSVVAFCALYGSMSLKGPIFAGQLNRHIESHNRATVLSLISMVSGIYVSLMGLLIGHIADASVSLAFVFMGAVVLLGALALRVKHLPKT
jgi:MFS family permease